MKSNRMFDGISDFAALIREQCLDLLDAATGRFLTILEPLKRLKRSSPELPEVGDRRRAANLVETGRKYYNEKRYHKAERCFKKAVFSDESYALAHYYHGLALYQVNLPNAAKIAWTRATEVDPESEAAKKAHGKLTKKLVTRSKTVQDLAQRAREK